MSNVVEFRAISQSGSVAPVGVSKQSLELLGRAEALLVNAQGADSDEMLELSYLAALRCAGALLNRGDLPAVGGTGGNSGARSNSTVRRRRLAPQSAWLRLKKEQPEFACWVAKFEQFTALREEVRLGIARRIDRRWAQELWELSCEFVEVVRAELGVLPAVA
ncbi:SAV_6107 family HEPN domain-containing protein [uncultured Corynebacterium sp.]|uniref:SAV_6107 family HEPN domain-containing protein n=1 Tax=uncultured Corynebacterium sp. TaxID=159447 RepID=UPI00261CAC36|nr:SAV_6107 family HEPN domain-containing protein [uncultured Corynebacterium sp.]